MLASRASLLVTVWLTAAAAPAAGQQPDVAVDPEVPRSLRTSIVAALARADLVSIADTLRIERDSTPSGSVVKVGGVLILDGRVDGDVTAVDAEVYVRPGARVAGDLVSFGGILIGSSLSIIEGEQRWDRRAPVRAVRTGASARVVRVVTEGRFPIAPRGVFGIVPREYNTVDGLSIGWMVGTRYRPRPRYRFSAGPVFRTARDNVGWDIELVRELASGTEIGGAVYSVTDSRQRWQRGDLRNSIAALFIADDGRTYHERTGYRLWIDLPVSAWARVGFDWRDDDFDDLTSQTPFSFFGDDDDWDDNPAITPGDGRSIGAWAELDRRDLGGSSNRGFLVRGRIEHWGFGDDLEFDWAEGDVRVYLPTTDGSFASLRALVGGRLGDGEDLAPQFLYRLGGRGSVVGYAPLTRTLTGDRMALANLRYHQRLPLTPRFFKQTFAVALLDVGDAWFQGRSADAHVGVGAGVAGQSGAGYVGAFVAYGTESDEWKIHVQLRPWF